MKKYYLVELSGLNSVKSVRSNCVLTVGLFKLPPLEMAIQTLVDEGYSTVNVLSVTRINKKTAEYMKGRINGVNAEKIDPRVNPGS